MGRRGIACLVFIALASAAGCRRTLQEEDASAASVPGSSGSLDGSLAADGALAADAAPVFGNLNQPLVTGARCGGTVEVVGLSPAGDPFRATAVDNWMCRPGITFHLIDVDHHSSIMLTVNVDLPGGGPLVPGKRSASAIYVAYDASGAIRDQASSNAELDITAADPLPFATCETGGSRSTLTGSLDVSITMLKDGFQLSGRIASPYCACSC